MPDPGLVRRVIEIPFDGTLDQKTRAELVEPGNFLTLTNVVKQKRKNYQKRTAFSAFGSGRFDGTSRSAGKHIVSLKNQPITFDGSILDVYSSGGFAWKSSALSNSVSTAVPEAIASREAVIGLTGATSADCAIANGFAVFLTVVGSNYSVVAVDLATGARVYQSESIALFGSGICLVSVGSYVILLSMNGANIAARAMLCTMSGLQAGFSAPTNVATDGGGAGFFAAVGLTSRVALIYTNSGGGATPLGLKTFNTSLTGLESTTINTGAVTIGAVAINGTESDTLWCAWHDVTGTAIKAQGRNPTSIASITYTAATMFTGPGSTPMSIGMVRTGAALFMLIASWLNIGTSNNEFHWRACKGSAGATTTNGSESIRYLVGAVTDPWVQGSRVYCGVVRTRLFGSVSTVPAEYYVVDVTDENSDLRAVCTVSPRLSALSASGSGNGLVHPANRDATRWIIPNVIKRSSVAFTVEAVTIDYSQNVPRYRSSEVYDELFIAGGVCSVFDGVRVVEAPILSRPDAPVAVDAGAGSLSAGTYRWIALYEDTSAGGSLNWSSPSDPSAGLVLAGSHQATLSLSSNPFTRRPNLKIAIYRTIANGATYFRVATVTNSKTAASVSYTDTISDTTISANALLYTQPGAAGAAQPRTCPPSLQFLIQHQGRLVGVGDDGVTLWVTGPRVVGESPWFADLFQYPCERGGPITGLASSDGRIIILKRGSIHVMTGDGPSENGAQGDYSQPEQIAGDCGCINGRSICPGPFGTVFQGGNNNGIYLLDRSMHVSYVGEPVEATLATYPIVTSAVLDDERGLVLFTVSATEDPASGASTSRIIAWDYVDGSWSLFDASAASGMGSIQSAAMISVFGGAPAYHIITPSGEVCRDAPTLYLDKGATYVSQVVETAWLHLAGLQGYQRLRRFTILADKKSNHDLKLELAFDYESSFTETKTWTAAQINALAREQLQYGLKRRKCMAIKARITCLTPSGGPAVGTGQGPILLGLALEAMMKPGIARLGASAKA